MLRTIRNLLMDVVDRIDTGNSNITGEEAMSLVKVLKEYTDKDKRISKYEACRYLNVSRATFDNYVRDGKLPRGTKEAGFKELSWSRKELDEYIIDNKK